MPFRRLTAALSVFPKTTAFLLGIFSVYALPPFHIFPVLFLSFSGLFCLLEKTADTAKKAWKLGYVFGFGHFAFGLSWIGNALLLDVSTFGWLYPLCLLAGGAFSAFLPLCRCGCLITSNRSLPEFWPLPASGASANGCAALS